MTNDAAMGWCRVEWKWVSNEIFLRYLSGCVVFRITEHRVDVFSSTFTIVPKYILERDMTGSVLHQNILTQLVVIVYVFGTVSAAAQNNLYFKERGRASYSRSHVWFLCDILPSVAFGIKFNHVTVYHFPYLPHTSPIALSHSVAIFLVSWHIDCSHGI